MAKAQIALALAAQLGNHNSKHPSGKGGSDKADMPSSATLAQNSNTNGDCSGYRGDAHRGVTGRGPDGNKSKNS